MDLEYFANSVDLSDDRGELRKTLDCFFGNVDPAYESILRNISKDNSNVNLYCYNLRLTRPLFVLSATENFPQARWDIKKQNFVSGGNSFVSNSSPSMIRRVGLPKSIAFTLEDRSPRRLAAGVILALLKFRSGADFVELGEVTRIDCNYFIPANEYRYSGV